MKKGQTPLDTPLRRANFVVDRHVASWRVQRNGRLVTFFAERKDAIEAAERYADRVRAKGGEAQVRILDNAR